MQIAVFIVLLFVALWVFTDLQGRCQKTSLTTLARSRAGESICEFARDFARREVDTRIIRAVYERLQVELLDCHALDDFPIRGRDRLIEDLHIDPEATEQEIAEEIADRAGRSMDNASANPFNGRVRTVRELVLFFNDQPLAAPKGPASILPR